MMKASPRLIAANLDDAQQRDAILEMTRDYFNWMNGEIKRAIGLTISDITGMDQNAYLTGMLETLCATRPPESVFHLVELEGEWAQGLLEVCPSRPRLAAALAVTYAGTASDLWLPSPPPRLSLQAI